MPDPKPVADQPLDIASALLERALKAGADSADALFVEGISQGVSWRLGAMEDLERAEGRDVGLRVFIGQKQAIISGSDTTPAALDLLAERAVAMARHAPEDAFCDLADPALLATSLPNTLDDDLDLIDPDEPSADTLIEAARVCEEAARAVDGITNSEGASASWGRSSVALATSTGFTGAYGATSHSISVSVLAGEGTEMERDYDYSSTRHRADLDDPEQVGRTAAEKTLARLNPRTHKPAKVPVVYDPRVSGGLVSHFASAISGAAVARGTSFLKDSMDEAVFAEGIAIVDDPLRRRGLRSKPFDAEGLATTTQTLIDDGRLTTWLLDNASAKQLGLISTGHASRGVGGPPSPSASNLYMEAGPISRDDLIGAIDDGFYVTELIGMGINGVTGDYSRGAGGFWIENGELAYPVAGLTVAGNLKEMYRHLTPADDLTFRYGVNAPTVRVDGMTVAGT